GAGGVGVGAGGGAGVQRLRRFGVYGVWGLAGDSAGRHGIHPVAVGQRRVQRPADSPGRLRYHRAQRPMTIGETEFDDFYAGTYRRVVGQVFAMVGNFGDAEEAVQEAYSRAWPRWPKLR